MLQPSSRLLRLLSMNKTLLAGAVLALTALVASPAAAAAPTVDVRPAALERGADVPDPHVEGRVLHDGSMRLRFDAPRVTLLGTSGDRYVVLLARQDGSRSRVIWIRADETQRVLARGLDASQVLLSRDGKQLISTPTVTEDATILRVVDARTGDRIMSRRFAGSVTVLDADAGRAVLGAWGPNRTLRWNTTTGRLRTINHRTGYFADIATDRLAVYTRDPYRGGCSVLTDISREPTRLSRSCSERVVAVSPDGANVATVGLLSDGPGPSRTTVRRASGGEALVHYRAPYVFGRTWWESDTTLLMDTYTERRVATVRCSGTDCERASAFDDVRF